MGFRAWGFSDLGVTFLESPHNQGWHILGISEGMPHRSLKGVGGC